MEIDSLLNKEVNLEKTQRKVRGYGNKFDKEYNDMFIKHKAQVPSSVVTNLAKSRRLDRELVRIWFHNRRTKERQTLLKKYKSSVLKLKSAMSSPYELNTFEELSAYHIHLQDECKSLLDTLASFQEGNFASI